MMNIELTKEFKDRVADSILKILKERTGIDYKNDPKYKDSLKRMYCQHCFLPHNEEMDTVICKHCDLTLKF